MPSVNVQDFGDRKYMSPGQGWGEALVLKEQRRGCDCHGVWNLIRGLLPNGMHLSKLLETCARRLYLMCSNFTVIKMVIGLCLCV